MLTKMKIECIYRNTESGCVGTCNALSIIATFLNLADHDDPLSNSSWSMRLTREWEDVASVLSSIVHDLLHRRGIRALLSPMSLKVALEAFPLKERLFCGDLGRLPRLPVLLFVRLSF